MGRREEKKAEKRARIERAGLHLFTEQGFERTSIEQVIAQADIARGTFYLYYPDKLHLFESIQRRWIYPLKTVLTDVRHAIQTAASPQECIEVYQAMGQRLAHIGLTNATELLLGIRELRANSEGGAWLRLQEQEIHELTVDLTVLAKNQGLIQIDNPQVASILITGAIEKVFYAFVTQSIDGDPISLATEVTQLLSRILGLGFK